MPGKAMISPCSTDVTLSKIEQQAPRKAIVRIQQASGSGKVIRKFSTDKTASGFIRPRSGNRSASTLTWESVASRADPVADGRVCSRPATDWIGAGGSVSCCCVTRKPGTRAVVMGNRKLHGLMCIDRRGRSWERTRTN